MYSWGYATVTPPDRATLQEVVDTFRMNNGYPQSQTGQISQVLYLANGVSTDWEYADTLHEGVRKFVTYAFTIEWGINDFWYGANDPSFVDNENRLNRPNNLYLTKVGGVFFEPRGVFINDTLQGNRSGQLDPGENAYVWFKLVNRAINPADSAYSISGVVRSSDPRVSLIDSTFTLPVVRRKDTTNTRNAMLRISASSSIPPNTIVKLRVMLSYLNDGFPITQPVDYSITIGSQTALKEEGAKALLCRLPTIIRKGLQIPINFKEEGLSFKLITPLGRIIKEEGEIKAYKEGVYFLEIDRGKEKEIKKIVILK
jgi:hypothetical protein